METFEFEGKTTEEAIENACRQLNLSKEEMDIEVMEPGSAGIFGLVGGRKARVKITTSRPESEAVAEANGLAIAKEALEKILKLKKPVKRAFNLHRVVDDHLIAIAQLQRSLIDLGKIKKESDGINLKLRKKKKRYSKDFPDRCPFCDSKVKGVKI